MILECTIEPSVTEEILGAKGEEGWGIRMALVDVEGDVACIIDQQVVCKAAHLFLLLSCYFCSIQAPQQVSVVLGVLRICHWFLMPASLWSMMQRDDSKEESS